MKSIMPAKPMSEETRNLLCRISDAMNTPEEIAKMEAAERAIKARESEMVLKKKIQQLQIATNELVMRTLSGTN